MKFVHALACVVACAFAACAAQASVGQMGEARESIIRHVHVKVSDADFATVAGRAKIDKRLRHAAHGACMPPVGDSSALGWDRAHCYAEAISAARASVSRRGGSAALGAK